MPGRIDEPGRRPAVERWAISVGRAELGRRSIRGRMVQYFFAANAGFSILLLLLITVFLFHEALGFLPKAHAERSYAQQSGARQVQVMHGQLDGYYAVLNAAVAGVEPDAAAAGAHALAGQARDWLLMQAMVLERLEGPQRLALASAMRAEWHDSWVKRLGVELAAVAAAQSEDWDAYMAQDGRRATERAAPERRVGWWSVVSEHLFGTRWVSGERGKQRFGVVALFAGTVLVALVALAIAVPVGLLGALYVNQFARRWERTVLKPSIEYLAALPTVVLGFLGLVYWSDVLVVLSQQSALAWVPGFPLEGRLNALVAGSLLAVMGIPIIFTLGEEALSNVPRDFTEASHAVGASRLQTAFRVVLPAAAPGLVSAVLLGCARIMGETMVVLLLAGNRISVPGFGDGLDALGEPVHTMTGIIAQEMGEVSSGGLHYRALFMVAALLFCMTLCFNHLAHRLVRGSRARGGEVEA